MEGEDLESVREAAMAAEAKYGFPIILEALDGGGFDWRATAIDKYSRHVRNKEAYGDTPREALNELINYLERALKAKVINRR